jgi:virginiamycin B lyase
MLESADHGENRGFTAGEAVYRRGRPAPRRRLSACRIVRSPGARRAACVALLALCLASVGAQNAGASAGLIEQFAVPRDGWPNEIAADEEAGIWLQLSYQHTAGAFFDRFAPDGILTGVFSTPSTGWEITPVDIAAGPGANMWYTADVFFVSAEPETELNTVGRIAPTGNVREFQIPGTEGEGLNAGAIASGAEGAMWFTETGWADAGKSFIGRLTTSESVEKFPIPVGARPDRPLASRPNGLAPGAGGEMWFTDDGRNAAEQNLIGRVTPTGQVNEFPIPTPNSEPAAITRGADGDMWFTEPGAGKIGRITPAGAIEEIPVPSVGERRNGIALGSDGNLWFAGSVDAPALSWITPAETVHSIPAADLSGGTIRSVAAGREGDIWFSSEGPADFSSPGESFIDRLVPPRLPAEEAAPALTGEATPGSLMRASPGSWTQEPTEFTYQWQLCNGSGAGCANIAAATANVYFLGQTDVGGTVRAVVNASNLAGSSSATSAPSPVVTEAPGPPGGATVVATSPLAVLPVTMTWRFSPARGGARVTTLIAHDLGVGTTIEITCRGRHCPLSRLQLVSRTRRTVCHKRGCHAALPTFEHGELSLAGIFRRHLLPAGTSIAVRFFTPGSIGRAYYFSVQRQQTVVRTACLAVGSKTAESAC